MNLYVKGFKKGSWLTKAAALVKDNAKVMLLLGQLAAYMQKGGLKKVQEDLKLLSDYVGDIIHGRYKEYSTKALVLAVASIAYVVSPLDLIPDVFLGVGFLDDVAIVTWALGQLTSELQKFKIWKNKNLDIV